MLIYLVAAISYLLCLGIVIAVLRISFRFERIKLGTACFVILVMIGLPFTVLWKFCHSVLQVKSGVKRKQKYFGINIGKKTLTISQVMNENLKLIAIICVIILVPNACLMACFRKMIIDFEGIYWKIFISINMVYYIIFTVVIYAWFIKDVWYDTCRFLKYILCSVFILPLLVSLMIIIMNIIGPCIYLLVVMKSYHFVVIICVGKDGYDAIMFVRNEKKMKNEYRKYIKYRDLYNEKRESLLMKYIDDKNIIQLIVNYLNEMEIKRKDAILQTIDNGEYHNDCFLIERLYQIDLELVRKYVKVHKIEIKS
eukprot:467118_1